MLFETEWQYDEYHIFSDPAKISVSNQRKLRVIKTSIVNLSMSSWNISDMTKLEVRGQDTWNSNTLVCHRNDLVMQLRFAKYMTKIRAVVWRKVARCCCEEEFDVPLVSFYRPVPCSSASFNVIDMSRRLV